MSATLPPVAKFAVRQRNNLAPKTIRFMLRAVVGSWQHEQGVMLRLLTPHLYALVLESLEYMQCSIICPPSSGSQTFEPTTSLRWVYSITVGLPPSSPFLMMKMYYANQ